MDNKRHQSGETISDTDSLAVSPFGLDEKVKEEQQQEEVKKAEEASRRREEKKIKQEAEEQERHEEELRNKQDERKKALTRSQQLVDELGEREHSEISPFEAVQLIVAERISWLGFKLYGDEVREEIALRSIEQQFDFLSVLAAKLADPETEVSSEIEEVYNQIVEAIAEPETAAIDPSLHEAHLRDESEDDELLEVLATTLSDENETYPVLRSANEKEDVDAEERHRHAGGGAAIAFAVASLAVACRHLHRAHSTSSGSYGASLSSSAVAASLGLSESRTSSNSTIPPVNNGETIPHAHLNSSDPSFDLPVVTAAAGAFVRRSESSPLETSNQKQAAVDEGVSYSDSESVSTPGGSYATRHEALAPAEGGHKPRLISTPPSVEGRSLGEQLPPAPAPHSLGAARRHQLPLSSGEPVSDTAPAHVVGEQSEKPVEFWSTLELLQAAEEVPIGGGQYLRRAFEHGEVDLEGLVKIVKDWKKGLPFRETFEKQRAILARKRAESREYLREDVALKHSTSAPTEPREPQKQTQAQGLDVVSQPTKKVAHTDQPPATWYEALQAKTLAAELAKKENKKGILAAALLIASLGLLYVLLHFWL